MKNTFYSKKIGRPDCGVNNYNKVTIINIRSDFVPQNLMECEDSFCCLKKTINPKTGNIIESVSRREMGGINLDCGLYIITIIKRS